MTVSGRVVREITEDELGLIQIGRNITEYAWDGRDEYGDQLANWVYLYQVKIYTNGREMKHRQTAADRAFKNGFGNFLIFHFSNPINLIFDELGYIIFQTLIRFVKKVINCFVEQTAFFRFLLKNRCPIDSILVEMHSIRFPKLSSKELFIFQC